MSRPSSYIKTEGAAVTRAADVASITGTTFSDFYRQDEGTFLLSAAIYKTFSATPGVVITNSAGLTGLFLHGSSASELSNARFYVAGDQVGLGPLTRGQFYRFAASYSSPDCAASVDGAVSVEIASAPPPPTDASAILLPNTNITKTLFLAYFPKHLPNATLQQLSALEL